MLCTNAIEIPSRCNFTPLPRHLSPGYQALLRINRNTQCVTGNNYDECLDIENEFFFFLSIKAIKTTGETLEVRRILIGNNNKFVVVFLYKINKQTCSAQLPVFSTFTTVNGNKCVLNGLEDLK